MFRNNCRIVLMLCTVAAQASAATCVGILDMQKLHQGSAQFGGVHSLLLAESLCFWRHTAECSALRMQHKEYGFDDNHYCVGPRLELVVNHFSDCSKCQKSVEELMVNLLRLNRELSVELFVKVDLCRTIHERVEWLMRIYSLCDSVSSLSVNRIAVRLIFPTDRGLMVSMKVAKAFVAQSLQKYLHAQIM